ncbi:interleukin-1 receptor-like 1 isoform X2 [Cynocephalus volans]|uniref:interleukin-1 receptor-like 1 isoform X2 n=1 Tax=Cynocephalus volans TaxID=110931 RepID=UPI002FC905D2
MGLWILAILTVLIHSTAAAYTKPFWGLENEALIVRCPRQGRSPYPVDWYYSKTNESIPTQKRNHVFASGEHLKFLPAKVNDSGIYTCIVRSPTLNRTGHANVTIHKKQPDCNIPDYLIFSTVFGSEKNSKIYCPTIERYNWTAPVEWFKNCQALQGQRYRAHRSFLVIDNVTSDDEGDYTCKFTHNENGANYTVTATRSFAVNNEQGFSLFPVITAPPHNETKEIEIGKTATIVCSACFGKGTQFLAAVLWQLNGSKVRDFGDPRIQEEEGQKRSSSNDMMCLNTVLRIAAVKDEDLSLKYDCVALNLHGVRRHSLRLRRRDPNTATAVETSIRKSRRYIFILTPQILHSREFAYEQEIALHSALIQGDSKAILIEMEALSKPGGLQVGEIQDSLRHLIKVQGTIKWREDHPTNKQSLNSKFWKHVRYQMPVPNKLPRKTSSLVSLSAQGQ